MEPNDYPIQNVGINQQDHKEPDGPRGGPPKFFSDEIDLLRDRLGDQVDSVYNYFAPAFQTWPELAAVAKVTLKEEALAKSHRPVRLFSNRTCPIIGNLNFGEVLVSVTPEGLSALNERIRTSNSKGAKANITAIEKIAPYDVMKEGVDRSVIELEDMLRAGVPVKLRTFDHDNDALNSNLVQAFLSMAEENSVSIESVSYGDTTKFFKLSDPNTEFLEKAGEFIGLQSISPMPEFVISDYELMTTSVGSLEDSQFPAPDDTIDYPVVGVIDSGVCPSCTKLAPWVVAKENYVPIGQENYNHGTMVAGLIANARTLNHNDERFPDCQSKIVDVAAFGTERMLEEGLVSIIEEAVPKYPEVRVWNLSLGCPSPASKFDFSDFAKFLDEMHDTHGVLFVISAGNHANLQGWPPVSVSEENRVSSPGDSIRGLTVGAVANTHKANSLVKTDEPSPFSRCGPGPCFTPKPEITQYGGNCTEGAQYAQTGIISTGPNNSLLESIGTSFATPIAASHAATLWKFLSESDSQPSAERIKALMIHASLVANPSLDNSTIHYHGFGRPGGITESLYCDENFITLAFEVDLRYSGFIFEKFPFPIPDSLITDEGKFRGEILMTLIYSPLIDRKFSAEYCRTNVDAALGSYELNDNGKREFSGKVPAAPKDIKDLYEKSQVEHGFKWSPVKAYQKVFPRGVAIDEWRLFMKVTTRAEEEIPPTPQAATLLITFRGIEGETPVYNEMMAKIAQFGWVVNPIDQHIRIQAQ